MNSTLKKNRSIFKIKPVANKQEIQIREAVSGDKYNAYIRVHLGHYSKITLNKTQFPNKIFIFKNSVMYYINSINF